MYMYLVISVVLKVHGNSHIPLWGVHQKVHGNFRVPFDKCCMKVHGNFHVPLCSSSWTILVLLKLELQQVDFALLHLKIPLKTT